MSRPVLPSPSNLYSVLRAQHVNIMASIQEGAVQSAIHKVHHYNHVDQVYFAFYFLHFAPTVFVKRNAHLNVILGGGKNSHV